MGVIIHIVILPFPDIDECTSGTDDCHSSLASCTNTVGSFSCACNDPSSGNGRTCNLPSGNEEDVQLTKPDDRCTLRWFRLLKQCFTINFYWDLKRWLLRLSTTVWSLVTGNTFAFYCERIVLPETVRLERVSVYRSSCHDQKVYFNAISTVTLRRVDFLKFVDCSL